MNKLIFTILILFFAMEGFAQVGYRDSVMLPGGGGTKCYVYVVLPDSYAANPTKYYPGIMFCPGSGEAANDWNDINKYGFNEQRIDSGWNGVVTMPDGAQEEFISYHWQNPTGAVLGASFVIGMKDTMASRLRIDTCRYYITGLSQGGQQTFRTIATTVGTDWGKKVFPTAAVIFSSGTNLISNASMSVLGAWTAVGGSIKYAVGASDPTRMRVDTVVLNANAGRAGSGSGYEYTTAQGWPVQNHGGWSYGFSRGFRWADKDSALSVWSWLLGHNKMPYANAGDSVITVTLPSTSTTLNGISKKYSWGWNGWNLTKEWTKVSGPSATITSSTSDTTSITGLSEGTYVFRFTTTSSGGLVATKDVTVNVTDGSSTWQGYIMSKKTYQRFIIN